MTFRGDVRDYFEGEAGAFPIPAGLRASAVAEAQRQPKTRHGVRFAAFAAAFIAMAIAAGVVAVGTYERNVQRVGPFVAPAPSAQPTVHTVPPGGPHRPVEIDFVDTSTGFALLCTNPNNGQCQYWVSATSNAGATWSKPVKVGPQVIGGESGHHLHFANGHDGIMYGDSSAFVTHDSGRTWHVLNMQFLEIVSVSGTSPLWMVMYPCAKGVSCPFQVLTSTDGAKTWKAASTLPGGFSPASVAAFGDSGLLMSGFGTGDMLITRDGGATWTPIAGQCPGDSMINHVATADGTEIWQMCTPIAPAVITTGRWQNSARYTQNGGATWHAAGGLPAGTYETIASFAFGVVVEATDTAGLLITEDAFKTWKQVANDPQHFGVLSFTWLSDGEAWAADTTGAVWMTPDYGKTWMKLPVQP